jgi:hypothetical protein
VLDVVPHHRLEVQSKLEAVAAAVRDGIIEENDLTADD